METKTQLVNHVKVWIKLDEEIREMQTRIKEKKTTQKELTNELVSVMKENQIDCFDLSDGKLIYTNTKIKQSINKKLLLSSLSKFFVNDDDLQKVTEHILGSRSEKTKENIKRKKING